MSERFLQYLRREQARLESLIDRETARPVPDRLLLARLKKLKLNVRDQISEIETGWSDRRAA
jgi:hypothetical protein